MVVGVARGRLDVFARCG